jgi:hypothetical protein
MSGYGKDMKLQENPVLLALLAVYAAASLVHFVHNAEYLADYPNLPDWFTRSGVYLTWAAQASFGLLGLVLYRCGRPIAGLLLIGLYAAFGFDGLLHYTRAPLGAHSSTMNFTIWLEVVAAATLLIAVARALMRRTSRHRLDA